jgi:hypothetical protein
MNLVVCQSYLRIINSSHFKHLGASGSVVMSATTSVLAAHLGQA